MSDIQLSSKQQIQLAKLEQEAERDLLSSSALPLILGGAAFCLFNPIGLPVALLAASPFFWNAVRNAHRNGLNAEYLARTGLFAHSLNADQLIRLTKIVGKDSVVSQLLAAREDRKPFSGDALDYLEAVGCDLEPEQDLKTFLLAPESVVEAAETKPLTVSDLECLGQSAPTSGTNFNQKTYSPIDAIVPDNGTIKSTLIVGVPGAGKGVVVSNAIQKLRTVRPDLTVFVADPKASEKESGYWAWLPREQLIREPILDRSPEDKEAWLFDVIEAFQTRCKRNALLVIDELTILVNALSTKGRARFGDKIVSISSGGDSEGLYLWGIAQTASAKSLGLGDGSIRSVLKGVAIVGGDNAGAIKSVRRTDFVCHIDDQDLARLRRKSPVDRAWYDGVTNSWYPMPELPNLSGYDRDSRRFFEEKKIPKGGEALEDQVISLLDEKIRNHGAITADQFASAIKKKFESDVAPEKAAKFLVRLTQKCPEKYELLGAATEITIVSKNLTGALGTPMTGYQRSSR